ncbi:MAG: mechanosensitive ion channel [Chromatiales bacterium]|jgi:small conductance mechanosensitive channel|nr:mechanosensitive ion channel [Chromatiales bacterium]MDH4029527.1 mechanosensitive ion channel [Chromatiales bacterium]
MEQLNGLLSEDVLSRAYSIGADFGVRLLAALAIFIIGRWVARRLAGLIEQGMQRTDADTMLTGFVRNLTYMGLLTFVILAAVGQLGVQTTSFIAVLGAAGFAVGLALQGSLGNFASGVLIMIFRPFKSGDFVEAGGTMGIVEAIQIFTTTLRTGDNKTIIVPNGQITSGTITNYSAKDTRRVDLVIGVSYGDDLDKVRRVIEEVIAAEGRVLSEPEPTIGVLELADSSVNFAVRPWVKSSDYWPVYFGLMESFKKRFDQEGISIPFPQQDVYLHQVSA